MVTNRSGQAATLGTWRRVQRRAVATNDVDDYRRVQRLVPATRDDRETNPRTTTQSARYCKLNITSTRRRFYKVLLYDSKFTDIPQCRRSSVPADGARPVLTSRYTIMIHTCSEWNDGNRRRRCVTDGRPRLQLLLPRCPVSGWWALRLTLQLQLPALVIVHYNYH